VGAAAELERVDLVVNATPLGLAGTDPDVLPLDPRVLGAGQLVVDLVPNPAVTPLMREARDRGARVAGGLGMLVHQGALAFELWTGQPAPVDTMRAAAVEALDR
jgi:shikimate dehydrogenase